MVAGNKGRCRSIPDSHVPIAVARPQPTPVRREVHRPDLLRARKRADPVSGGRAPETCRAVQAPGQDQRAVGRERGVVDSQSVPAVPFKAMSQEIVRWAKVIISSYLLCVKSFSKSKSIFFIFLPKT